ncbi:MAG: ribonuclease HI [Candidatus Omnitrophota bacterium]
MTDDLVIHVDGACRGNPGPSAVGVLIQDKAGQTLAEISDCIGVATNNIAEYTSLIFALQEAVFLKAKKVDLFTDSQLMARQMSGEYKVKDANIKIVHCIAKKLTKYFNHCSITHVPREKNKEADKLAGNAIKNLV